MYSVLIVDDDTQLLRLMRDVFEIEGWHVTVCSCAEKALIAIEAQSYDCCVVDLKLPDVEGHTLIQQLKATLNIPIIAISGLESGLDLVATKQTGAAYHLKKPFEPDELLIECRRLIEHNQECPVSV
jgi:DNA-binding response OmpR family regulator